MNTSGASPTSDADASFESKRVAGQREHLDRGRQ
jgi:hypothetical protein